MILSDALFWGDRWILVGYLEICILWPSFTFRPFKALFLYQIRRTGIQEGHEIDSFRRSMIQTMMTMRCVWSRRWMKSLNLKNRFWSWTKSQSSRIESKWEATFFFQGHVLGSFVLCFFLLKLWKNRLSWRTSGKTMDLYGFIYITMDFDAAPWRQYSYPFWNVLEEATGTHRFE